MITLNTLQEAGVVPTILIIGGAVYTILLLLAAFFYLIKVGISYSSKKLKK